MDDKQLDLFCFDMYEHLVSDVLKIILDIVEEYHIKLGLEKWKSSMCKIHSQYRSAKKKWFVNVSFFVDHHTRQPKNIKFIRGKYIDTIYEHRDLEEVPQIIKKYYGIEHLPKYSPDWMRGCEFDLVGLWFDSTYDNYTW